MKKIGLLVGYLVLGGIALGVRILKVEDTIYYMSIINIFAGFVTLAMILINVLARMIDRIKEKQQSLKRINKFCIFALLCLIIYGMFIKNCYQIYDAELLNDAMTICTLTIALTTDLFENILLAIFYKG